MPLLGDIPFIGGLFRSESRERKRTNLMVFLRPVVMRDAGASDKFSLERYDQIRGEQQRTQPTPSLVMPINRAPVLPEVPQTSAPVSANAPTAGPAPVAPPLVAPAAAEPAASASH